MMFSLHPRRLVGTKAKKVICATFNERQNVCIRFTKYWNSCTNVQRRFLPHGEWMSEMPFTIPLFCEKENESACLLLFSCLISLSYVHSSYHQLSTVLYIFSLALLLLCLIFFFCVFVCICTYVHPSDDFLLNCMYVRSCCWCCKTPYPFSERNYWHGIDE